MDQLITFLGDGALPVAITMALGVLVGGGVLVATRSKRTQQPEADSFPDQTALGSSASSREAATGTADGETHALPADTPTHEKAGDTEGPGTAETLSTGSTAALPADAITQADTAAGALHAAEHNEAEQSDTVPAAAPVETPESVPSRMERLRGRLARSGAIGKALLSVLSKGELKATDWEEIEDTLLVADLGLAATEELMDALRTRVKIHSTTDAGQARKILAEELEKLVDPTMDRTLNLGKRDVEGMTVPASILVVGVNGTGKTTTVGKLARVLVAQNQTVLLGAADTFRAAASQQLATWAARVGVDVVASEKEGADPASVAFETVKAGIDRGVDVVMVDTAGRLQNKAGLMDELGKVRRVMERHAPLSEVLLVLDATTGQNGLTQAKVFAEVAGVTGIVLTKLDGSAKGGIVVSVQRELGVPVKYVGLGEGVDDLAPFDPRAFVEAIVGA
ncbi:signal recognition particle-docking protein FtsY [Schaalia suimastitidis]|uniref:signal recognition particle-docking protein FtsY n=1 Tax=Schaalia suimastitidis TaxID=121163 RepID=UPI0003FF38CF|nr:signal recognition particle-docking protein FtsY [Schaalia suimastitidis]